MGEVVLIGSCAGTFYALDKKTGEVRWSYDIKKDGDQTSFHGNPLITEDLIIIGTDGRSGSSTLRYKLCLCLCYRANREHPCGLARSGDDRIVGPTSLLKYLSRLSPEKTLSSI